MGSFEIKMAIYNSYLKLIVTPLDNKFHRFQIKTMGTIPDVMILKYTPDESWSAEKVSMKYFTKGYIAQLGRLIETKKHDQF